MCAQSPKWFGVKRGGSMARPMVRKKKEEELAARSFRTKRKKIAKQAIARTGLPVHWKAGKLIFQQTGNRVRSARPIPKPATASAA